MKTFVCSDIHGNFTAFQYGLNEIGLSFSRGDKLIILGDMIDRGKHSRACLRFIKELQEEHPNQVIVLLGNHEDMLLQFLSTTNESESSIYHRWLSNGGSNTIRSMLNYFHGFESPEEIREKLLSENKDLITWIKQLPHYYVSEEENAVFVHAGFRSNIRLESQNTNDLLWIREGFLEGFEAYPGDILENKIIVHGHTPNCFIKGYEGIGVYKRKNLIGIDGGAALNKSLVFYNFTDDVSIVKKLS